MNEGMMIHPMHLHGMHMTVIDKDGWPQPAPWKCDTLNIAPGERWDVIVNCNEPRDVGVSLPHPTACRVGARHVRNGDGADRAEMMAAKLLVTIASPPADPLALRATQGSHSPRRPARPAAPRPR